MSISREPIYSAMFALLQGIAGVNTASRRLKSFADIGNAESPAVFMLQKAEIVEYVTKVPEKWLLHVDVILYVNTGGNDPNVIPSSALNPFIDLVVNTVVLPAAGEQTLGGLVQRCRVKGTIEILESPQGDTAVAIIPVEILAV